MLVPLDVNLIHPSLSDTNQPCTNHTAGYQDCELCKLTGFVLFICVALIAPTIMICQYVFVDFNEIGAFIFKG